MKKKKIVLEEGTFIDLGTLKEGQSAVFLKPDGEIISTSKVVRYVILSDYVEVETLNTVYVSKPPVRA